MGGSGLESNHVSAQKNLRGRELDWTLSRKLLEKGKLVEFHFKYLYTV